MALSRFEFIFPEEAMRATSHVQWIKRYIPHLERTVVLTETIQNLNDYLGLLVLDNIILFGTGSCGEGKDEAREENLSGESYRTSMGFIGCNLNMAAFYIYRMNFRSARSHLEQVQMKLADESETGKEGLQAEGERFGAVQYCVDAAELTMKVVEYMLKIQLEEAVHEIALETRRLQKKWEEIEGNPEAKATVVFLEGFLAGGLQIKKEEDLKKFKEAASLDPDYHIWNHFAYRKIRFLRRTYRNKGDSLADPGKEERDYCKRAYDLRPDYLPMIIDYALLLKELIWTKRGGWDEESVQKCIEMFKEALQAAKDDKTKYGKFWLRKLKIYYGEFLLFGKHSSLDQEFGRQLFDESMAEYPNDPFVLHKVAKLHHRGAYRSPGSGQAKKEEQRDLEKAKLYFRMALISGWNYPCFIDYLKFMKEFRPYAEIIKAMDDFPCTSRQDFDEVRILAERGCIMWLYHPIPTAATREEACKVWIMALVKYPHHAEYVYDAMERPHRLGCGKPSFVMNHLVLTTIEQMNPSNAEEVEAVSAFRSELKKRAEVGEDKGKKTFAGARRNNYDSNHNGKAKQQSRKHVGSDSDRQRESSTFTRADAVEDLAQLKITRARDEKKMNGPENGSLQNHDDSLNKVVEAISELSIGSSNGRIGRIGRGRGIHSPQNRDSHNENRELGITPTNDRVSPIGRGRTNGSPKSQNENRELGNTTPSNDRVSLIGRGRGNGSPKSQHEIGKGILDFQLRAMPQDRWARPIGRGRGHGWIHNKLISFN